MTGKILLEIEVYYQGCDCPNCDSVVDELKEAFDAGYIYVEEPGGPYHLTNKGREYVQREMALAAIEHLDEL
jgi:hypothetical protein